MAGWRRPQKNLWKGALRCFLEDFSIHHSYQSLTDSVEMSGELCVIIIKVFLVAMFHKREE